MYEHAISGVCGIAIWGESVYIPPLPPNFGRQAGRPKKARRRGPDEPVIKTKKGKGPTKLKRNQKTVKCSVCGQEGHNKRGCHRIRDNGANSTVIEGGVPVGTNEVGETSKRGAKKGKANLSKKRYKVNFAIISLHLSSTFSN